MMRRRRLCRYCAYCNGLTRLQIETGACRAKLVPVVDTCADPAENHRCRFFTPDPVCDRTGTTYMNRECAGCNGVPADSLVAGACYDQEDPWDPCESLSCPAHASCAKLIADCDFEQDGLCGWTSSSSSGLKWSRHKGPTDTQFTGPSTDHTLGDASGHFMFMDASHAAGVEGLEAHLVSPTFNATANGYNCRVSFWFHMYGPAVNALEVDIKELQYSNRWQRLWHHVLPEDPGSEVHDQWQKAELPLDKFVDRGVLRLRFNAIAGGGPAGDIGEKCP